MTTALEASPSVTSLTSADIDPHLLGQPEPTPEVAQPVAESAEPGAGGGSGGGGFSRGNSSRISMRRNTVPLMRQDALRNGAPADAAAAAAASSSRTGRGHHQVCRYCLRLFDDRRNPKGACPEAPDRLKACIDRLTCLTLADGVSYHCCADSEGDYIQPCQLLARHRRHATRRGDSENGSHDDYDVNCGRGRNYGGEDDDAEDDDDRDDDADGARSSLLDRLKAWSCICLLALFVPCLCCYPVCSLAHRACQRLHLAGGRHVALWTDPMQPTSSGVKKDPTRNTIAGMVAAEESNAATATIDGANVSIA